MTDVVQEALEALVAEVSQPEKERIVSTAERLRQAGRLEANRSTLLRQIAIRFKGSVTPEVERRVRAADAAQLERWIDGILTATSLDSLLSS